MEKIEIWNEQLQPTGVLKDRILIHRDGDIHAVVRIHILRIKQGKIQMLLQKRSFTCEAFPGFYDISCAGHVQKQEEAIVAAIRELQEELGIIANKNDLTLIGKKLQDWSRNTYLDKEMSFIYLYTKPIETIVLQHEEVEKVMWMNIQDLLPQLQDEITAFCFLRQEIEMVIKAYQNL